MIVLHITFYMQILHKSFVLFERKTENNSCVDIDYVFSILYKYVLIDKLAVKCLFFTKKNEM